MPHAFLARLLAVLLLGAASLVSLSAATTSATLDPMVAPRTLRSDAVTLLWTKLPRGAGAAGYEVLVGGKVVASGPKTHATLTGLKPATRYAVVVRAVDASGKPLGAVSALSVQTPQREPVLSVVKFGAKGDGKTLNTKAIQSAIDACPPNGIVLVPEGTFLTGALFLKSDMTLLIAKGGVLKGSESPDDYLPFYRNRFEGWELDTYASLLNAGRLDAKGPANVRNISIRGEGTLSGGGRTLGRAMIAAHGLRSRGRLVCLMNAENVQIQGLNIEQPPGWTLHYIYSENVMLHDLKIVTAVRNGDGIDPDSSRRSYIINCDFDTGDDCIAVKSGKNPEGALIARPTETVHIIDCRFTQGHGISIGSEMSGGVRDVLVQDCVAGALLHGLQIKGTKDRGGFVEDVVVRDCDLQKITVLTALPYNNDGEPAANQPIFRNFRFENIDLSKADAAEPVINVNGFPAEGHRTSGLVFDGLRLPAGATIRIDRCEDVSFSGLQTTDGTKPVFNVTDSERVTW